MAHDSAIPQSIKPALVELIDHPIPGSRAWELFSRCSYDWLDDGLFFDKLRYVEDWDPDFDPRSILIKDL